MMQPIVSPSLIVKKKPSKPYKEGDFCLGIVGWCPCSDCSSFSLDDAAIPKLESVGIYGTRYGSF